MPDDNISATVHKRPMPRRPRNGLKAWEATMGYISDQYSPDATLKLEIYPYAEDEIAWAASVSWAQNVESVEDRPSAAAALCDLWLEVSHNHSIFKTLEAAIKSPANYDEDNWLDERTADAFDRLICVADAMYKDDWLLIFIYQPVQSPDTRVQARLLARDNSIRVGGRGPSLHDACNKLYHNAASSYAADNSSDE